jgi:multidrug efflux pump subunit AcrA (membrane-fusion protein)
VSQKQLDQATAAYASAYNTLSYSKTQLNLSTRDLEKTNLSAPFDAVIAARHVEPFQEIKRGEPIYDIFMEGAMEVVIDIPETVIGNIYLGLPAQIRFPKSPDRVYEGIVSEVSSTAGSASTFQVKVAVKDTGGKIRPGMSAEVNLVLSSSVEETGFLVPFHAFAPGDKETASNIEETGFLVPFHAFAPGDKETASNIFVFDPKTSTVKKTQVEAQDSVDNNIVVTKGVKPGDIVAIAGVSYLRDGQKVKLME